MKTRLMILGATQSSWLVRSSLIFFQPAGFAWTSTGSITISLAEPITGVSCRAIVQIAFPDKNEKGEFLAGGHDGIAGSPRGKVLSAENALEVSILFSCVISYALHTKE